MVRISDARMSGTAFGTIVLHVTPEVGGRRAARAGADGDRIRLDVPKRSIELLVDDAELAARAPPGRRRRAHEGSRPRLCGLFQQHVLQADEGCDFDFLRSRCAT